MNKLITTNKRAYFDYEVLESYEAGIVLQGPEVKSTKAGKIDLTGGYISFDKKQTPWLINIKIAPYPPAKGIQQDYNPKQSRRLLLNKKEISKIIGHSQNKGLTSIPLKVYNKNGFIKLEIGVVRGKRKFDKRETIKKRELERKINREIDR
jgi:SsrA-binding protein